ncbi:hypothetical protein DPMN_099752 [Dreissena polymorpha]|uniref:Uncharacterized protein n=1 Tax=Dreissena polymorpha TaxID=45954 RepID=A0A9D4LEG9_DREPO|nr:hypothetical protein DPMN_099752 [Dreissena polymorpha]
MIYWGIRLPLPTAEEFGHDKEQFVACTIIYSSGDTTAQEFIVINVNIDTGYVIPVITIVTLHRLILTPNKLAAYTTSLTRTRVALNVTMQPATTAC